MSPWQIAALYCVAVVAASLLGGSIPHFIRLTHTRMQVALSFVAGVMLGIGLLHLLPHGFFALQEHLGEGAMDRLMLWATGGFLAMFFLERFFHFHHHDAPAPDTPHDLEVCLHEHDHADHGHDHHHDHACEQGLPTARFAWLGALVGLTLHGLMDGVSLAASVQVDAEHGHLTALAGFGTFLAVVLHKPFDALTIGTLLAARGATQGRRLWVNLVYSLITPLGVALFFFGVSQFGAVQEELVGCVLGFAGGAFLCIATSDLLPELQFHSHDRLKLSISLILGVLLAWGIVFLEESGHGEHPHVHDQGHPHSHPHNHPN